MTLLLLSSMLGAAAAEPEPPDPVVQQAEYVRVSGELKRAAQRNAWKGVERHYQRALETGAKVSAEDHIIASQASKHIGDVGSMRTRLLAAVTVDPTNKDVIQQLTALDSQYARVRLKAEVGTVLEDYERPFDPLKLKAVDFAIATMKETGAFNGLLPPGPYALKADPFELKAGQVFELDLSPPPPPEEPPVPVWKR